MGYRMPDDFYHTVGNPAIALSKHRAICRGAHMSLEFPARRSKKRPYFFGQEDILYALFDADFAV